MADDKIGYIDSAGTIVIPPQLYAGGVFSEGLAAVRQDGRYGFINQDGKLVIPAEYDFASDFLEGMAVVYKDGRPMFINRAAEVVLPRTIVSCSFTGNDRAVVQTSSGRKGIIDVTNHRLVVDTLYKSIGTFNNGLAVVEEFAGVQRNGELRQAIIDTSGKIIVPFGRYQKIQPYAGGYAVVYKGRGDSSGIIDRNGKQVWLTRFNRNCLPGNTFHNGLATINLYKYWIPENKGVIATSGKDYEGYINLQGKIVLNDTTIERANAFSCGRAFIKHKGSEYILINTAFERMGSDSYFKIQGDGFEDGKAIVQLNGRSGIIDTNGRFIVPADYDEIKAISGRYFIFSESDTSDRPLYGLATLDNRIIIKPVMQELDSRGFVKGLLNAVIDDRQVYINEKGKIIWKGEPRAPGRLTALNIDFMNRGYCYAYSTPAIPGQEELGGGWSVSGNHPTPITTTMPVEPGKWSLVIDTMAADTFQQHYYGYRMCLANTTADTMLCNAQDSRLYMKMQAQDANNQWRDIEYLPASWCGNSYHQLKLEPGACWRFVVPLYEGQLPVLLRMQVAIRDNKDPKKEILLYSNSIRGSVNAAQYWRKPGYRPGGIMDPYSD